MKRLREDIIIGEAWSLGLPSELWLNEIIERHLPPHRTARTRVMLKRTCSWLHHHVLLFDRDSRQMADALFAETMEFATDPKWREALNWRLALPSTGMSYKGVVDAMGALLGYGNRAAFWLMFGSTAVARHPGYYYPMAWWTAAVKSEQLHILLDLWEHAIYSRLEAPPREISMALMSHLLEDILAQRQVDMYQWLCSLPPRCWVTESDERNINYDARDTWNKFLTALADTNDRQLQVFAQGYVDAVIRYADKKTQAARQSKPWWTRVLKWAGQDVEEAIILKKPDYCVVGSMWYCPSQWGEKPRFLRITALEAAKVHADVLAMKEISHPRGTPGEWTRTWAICTPLAIEKSVTLLRKGYSFWGFYDYPGNKDTYYRLYRCVREDEISKG